MDTFQVITVSNKINVYRNKPNQGSEEHLQ